MGIQFWIWLAIIVITFIARARKKKEQESTPAPPRSQGRQQQQPTFPESTTRPVTFEELLREIQATKNPKPVQQPQKQFEVVDYDDDLQEEYKETKPVDYDVNRDDKVYEIYEQSKKQAFERPSLEETMKLADTDVTFSQFKNYQWKNSKKAVGSEFLDEIKTPQGFKKAFIMSEILKRKF